MKRPFLALITLALFASCSSKWVQIVKTGSNNCKEIPDGDWRFENDTVAITYYFWGENGQMSFSIYNKLAVPIYIDWGKSALIGNGIKNAYWSDVTIREGGAVSVGRIDAVDPSTAFGQTSTYSYSKEERTQRVVFIPPGSAIYTSSYRLMDKAYDLPNPDVKYKPKKKKKTANMEEVSQQFTEENSLSIFRNFITYSTSEKMEPEQYVDNLFYIQEIQELPINKFEEYKYDRWEGVTKHYIYITNPKWYYRYFQY